MSRNLVSNLIQAIRSGAYHTPLKNLERQGYRTVTVLPAQKLDEIVSKAVEITLREYGLPLDAETVRGLSNDAKVAFVNLVRERDKLRETNEALEAERQQLARNEEMLRHEMVHAEERLAEHKQQGAPQAPVDASSFEERVRHAARGKLEERLQRIGNAAGANVGIEMRALANEIVGLAGRLLGDENAAQEEKGRREHEEKVQLLERRVRKLQTSLAETQSMLERLQSERVAESGVPSVYREVQGLSPSENRFEQKRMLLAEIFKLNVELRELIENPESSDPARRHS